MRRGATQSLSLDTFLQSHPFYSHAACYWGDHVRAIKDLRPDVIEFLKEESKLPRLVSRSMRRGATQSLSLDTFGSNLSGLRHPFYSHAACYWGDHVRAIKDLRPDVIEFLKDQPLSHRDANP
jgi:hypothetical protein